MRPSHTRMDKYARATLFGAAIVSTRPGPFTSIDAVDWRLPDGRILCTRALRHYPYPHNALQVQYVPRIIRGGRGIASSMGEVAE